MKEPPGHGAVVAGAVAAMILAAFTVFSAGSITHGFVAYYTASRLLASGELGPQAYDDQWFGARVQQFTTSTVREIFIPNPPTMSLMALPLARLDAQSARTVWLVASLAGFVAAIGSLTRFRARQTRDLTIPVVLLMMLAPAVFTNLRIGQGYLFVCALFTAAALMLARNRDGMAGVCLGLMLALKVSGIPLAAILVAQKRWTVLIAAVITAGALAVAITPFIDASMWAAFPLAIQSFIVRPAGSVTAYQTTLGLFRHLCVADPGWNPSPAADCAAMAFAVPALINAAAILSTMVLASRATRREPWLAAAAALSVVTLPAAAEPHYALMAIPLALLRLSSLETLAVGALLIVPLEWTAERFVAGWWSLLAYPRLYAGWLLWFFSTRELRR